MGLDVYLYHSTDRAVAKAAEEEYERLSEAEWEKHGGYSKATNEQKEEIRVANEETAKRLGCTGEYNSYHTVTKIEQPSEKHPNHLFKIGYLRSSYNSGGINSVLTDMRIPGLYELFKPEERYEFTPDWRNVKEETAQAIELLKTAMEDPLSSYFASFVGFNMFIDPNDYPKDETTVMDIFAKHLPRFSTRAVDSFIGPDYSSSEGSFFGQGAEIYAAIPGTSTFKEKGVYLVIKSSKDQGAGEHRLTFYLQALEIVQETVDFVLSQPDPQNYYLHWSS